MVKILMLSLSQIESTFKGIGTCPICKEDKLLYHYFRRPEITFVQVDEICCFNCATEKFGQEVKRD